jgi:hypothetical protein
LGVVERSTRLVVVSFVPVFVPLSIVFQIGFFFDGFFFEGFFFEGFFIEWFFIE